MVGTGPEVLTRKIQSGDLNEESGHVVIRGHIPGWVEQALRQEGPWSATVREEAGLRQKGARQARREAAQENRLKGASLLDVHSSLIVSLTPESVHNAGQ